VGGLWTAVLWGVPTPRPRGPVRLPPDALANVPAPGTEGELVEQLYAALAGLPTDERLAAMVAFGFAEGPAGVAVELDLDPADAEALARSALQRLRGQLGDLPVDEPEFYARLRRRRRRSGPTEE
jgi:DNA-directed RNA polymerase specialized sigma24 family protein